MRVLLVASELPPTQSGVARSVATVAEGLVGRGHDVVFLSGADAPYAAIGEFRFSSLATRWVGLRRLVDDFDIVNLHGPAPFISDAFLARVGFARRSSPTPLVYTHHFSVELQGFQRASNLYNHVHRWLTRFADAVIVTTPSYGQQLEAQGLPSPSVVPWGIDPDRFGTSREPYEGNRPLEILFVGQMRPYKGIPCLANAVAGTPELELTIAGGGAQAEQVRQLVEDLDGDNVRYLGRVDEQELARLYRTCDVIALPSVNRLEAFGMVLLEGMSAGCVPVASDLPGLKDVIASSGHVVPPRDVVALRETLLDLARSPDRVARLSRAAVSRAAEFRWEETISAYGEILEGTGAGRGRSPVLARPYWQNRA